MLKARATSIQLVNYLDGWKKEDGAINIMMVPLKMWLMKR